MIAVNVPPHLDPHQRHLWGVPTSPHHLFGYSVQNAYGFNPFVPTTVDPTSFAHTNHPIVAHQQPAQAGKRSSFGGHGLDGRGPDGRGSDGRGPDGRGPDGRGSDGRGSDGRGPDDRCFDGRGPELQALDIP